MARMIDGNKLVENLRLIATCWSISPFVSKEKHNGAVNMLREVEREVKKAPTLTPPNEWVSVENALPPNMDDVLVVVQNNGERWTVTGYYSNTSNVWYAMLNGQDTQMDVLWWMPLPVPPDRRPPEGDADA